METGLESLFSSAFSLGKEQSSSSVGGPPDAKAMVSAPTKSFPRLIATILLGASCVAWNYAKVQDLAAHDTVQFFSIVIAGSNSLYNLSFATPRTDRKLSYIVLQTFELFIAVVFVRAISTSPTFETDWQITKFGLWYLMALTIQEGWSFVSSLPAPPASAPAQVPEPVTQNSTAPVRRTQAPNELSTRLAGRTPRANDSSASYTRARPENTQVNQRTSRARTRNEVRRDSLGVDRLGGLSLGNGW